MQERLKTPTLSRREQKKQANRERIRQAAFDLFHRKGFTATTVEEITDAAMVAKGTFFNYFPTKESVLFDLGEWQLGGLSLELQMAFQATSAYGRIAALLRALADGLEHNRELIRQALTEAMRAPDIFSPDGGRFSLGTMLTLLVAQGQRAGEFRKPPTAEAIAQALTALCFQQLYVWATVPDAGALAPRLLAMLDLLTQGIAANPTTEDTADD